ncbi:MAG: carboxypeptidase regulatory-like domain-containing protein [Candidatus Schekmanbacteria bacterium]|nr:carboxypeptidase regulatory-like domain-containing protein [Candidatus Schekmanbacteria bacterium]
MLKRLTVIAIAGALLLPASGCGDREGALFGKVRDATDLILLPDVTVAAKSRKNGALAETKTDQAGQYRFTSLADGPYEIKAKLEGYADATTYAEIFTDSNVRADVTLSPSATSVETSLIVTVLDQRTRLPIVGARVNLFVGPVPGGLSHAESKDVEAEDGTVEFETDAIGKNVVRYYMLQVVAVGYLNEIVELQMSDVTPDLRPTVLLTAV